ncbi:hypothetical protein G9P44_001487 [Scheffersomyces stipitis]|nr:hypothetical protein G9P44_001487 [Scheffersomyces stipitis]
MSFEELPAEILSQIAFQLPQQDALHWGYTCKQVYSIVQPILYHCIEVNSQNKTFSAGSASEGLSSVTIPNYFNDETSFCMRSVKVSTLFSLKRFFSTLQDNPQLLKHIRYLSFHKRVPDMPDIELQFNLSSLLKGMTNIKVFQWYNHSYNLPMELISGATAMSCLAEASGNFSMANSPGYFWPNLRTLNISNYSDPNFLKQLNLGDFPNLTELVISRGPTSSNNFNRYEDEKVPEYVCVDNSGSQCVANLFQNFNSPRKLQLRSLTLKDTTLTFEDAKILAHHIEMAGLQELSIINCFELLYEQNDFQNIRRRRFRVQSFLQALAPRISRLKTLNIYLTNELNYNNKTLGFLSKLHQLQSLNLIMNFNKFEDLKSNIQGVFQSLCNGHLNRSLKFLNFDYNVVNSGSTPIVGHYNTEKDMGSSYTPDVLQVLDNFVNLQHLRLPISECYLAKFYAIARNIHRLETLRLDFSKSIKKPEKAFSSLIHEDYFTMMKVPSFEANYNLVSMFARDLKKEIDNLKTVIFQYDRDDKASNRNITCSYN